MISKFDDSDEPTCVFEWLKKKKKSEGSKTGRHPSTVPKQWSFAAYQQLIKEEKSDNAQIKQVL